MIAFLLSMLARAQTTGCDGLATRSGALQITQPTLGLCGGVLYGIVARKVVDVEFTAPVDGGDVQQFTVARRGVVNISPVVPPDRLVDDDLGKLDHQLRTESGAEIRWCCPAATRAVW